MVFFFLKQKTAYEMRISDWSSDVCSSDLRHEKPPPRAKRRCRQKSHRPYLIFQIQQLTWQWQQVFAAPTAKKQAIPSKTRLTPARRRAPTGTEIGRASCRERVCQYG